MNFQKLLKEAQKAQKKAAEVQERLEREFDLALIATAP